MIQHHITLIEGDGVGPEVTKAARQVIAATPVKIKWDKQLAGKKIFEQRISSGVTPETVASILKNGVVLKGPLETPIGHGGKSANVTLRKLFEIYGNIRPAHSLPGVITPFSDEEIDLVIIRENVEDLYTGIEHMQTPSVDQCLKIITRKGCEKIVRLAFEFARSQGRKTVHCATKANIMKLSEGMLKRVFEAIAPEYPEIKAEHIIIDNCANQLVIKPSQFDVIVTTNLNGDILSDLCAGLVGGLGFAPSANIGNSAAIFEAVHGSAPTIAGQNIVNPTSMILSSVLMLRYLGEFEAADLIEKGIYATLADQCFTADVPGAHKKLSTTQFTQKVIDNLGKNTPYWTKRHYHPMNLHKELQSEVHKEELADKGVDIFIRGTHDAKVLGADLEKLVASSPLLLHGISNRGMQVYPPQVTTPDLVDSWQCRFKLHDPKDILTPKMVHELVAKIDEYYTWSHIEKLPHIGTNSAYTQSAGED